MGFYVSSTSEYVISPEVSPAIVWDGGWHHIIGSYDGDRVRLWIDGSQVGAGTPATGPIVYAGSGGIYIGTYRGSCDLGFSGAIDDVTVWDDRPAEATTGARIDPVADAPTHIAIGSGSNSTRRPVPTAPPAEGLPARVAQPPHHPGPPQAKLVATVRRGSRRVAGARLVVSGKGVTTTGARTDRKGKTKLSVRAARPGASRSRSAARRAELLAPPPSAPARTAAWQDARMRISAGPTTRCAPPSCSPRRVTGPRRARRSRRHSRSR